MVRAPWRSRPGGAPGNARARQAALRDHDRRHNRAARPERQPPRRPRSRERARRPQLDPSARRRPRPPLPRDVDCPPVRSSGTRLGRTVSAMPWSRLATGSLWSTWPTRGSRWRRWPRPQSGFGSGRWSPRLHDGGLLKVARETATLDRLSGGRLTLGVGLGSDGFASEYSITGEELDDRRRASMLDESLEVLAAAWSGESVHHRGEHYTARTARRDRHRPRGAAQGRRQGPHGALRHRRRPPARRRSGTLRRSRRHLVARRVPMGRAIDRPGARCDPRRPGGPGLACPADEFHAG